MAITASKLRENIYNILDEVIETGVPVEVTRKGKTLKIVPENVKRIRDLSKLPVRDCIVGDPDDLVHIDWMSEWSELKNLDGPPDEPDE